MTKISKCSTEIVPMSNVAFCGEIDLELQHWKWNITPWTKFECKTRKSDIYWISVPDRRAFQWSFYSSMTCFFHRERYYIWDYLFSQKGILLAPSKHKLCIKIHFVILFDRVYNQNMDKLKPATCPWSGIS